MTQKPPAPIASPIKLGLMSPLTGLVELYGAEISWAGRIACDEINESGGVLGRPLELIIEDDGSLPETAVPAALKLVEEHGCAAIIGNLLSNSRIAVAERVAEPKRVPYLNFSFYEGSIWSRYFFHFAALPNQQIEKMIPYMAEKFGPKMYFAGSNYEWPRGSIDAGKRALIRVGGEVVGEHYLPIGTDDVEELLDSVAKSGADVFVPYFAGSDQINLLTQFTKRGLKERMAVVMGHYDEAMVASLPAKVRKGFYSSNTYFMSIDTPENARYLKRLSRLDGVDGIWPRGNGVVTNFGEGAYNCVHAFAKAVQMAGCLDTEMIVDALEQTSIIGLQGRIDMDPTTHHAKLNTFLSKCNADGTFSIIESFGRINPVIPQRYASLFPGLEKPATKPKSEFVWLRDQHAEDIATETNADTSNNILKSADVSIIAINEQHSIIQANHAACVLFGYALDELIGLEIHKLVPPHFRNDHKDHITRFIQSDITQISMSKRGEVFGYRKDGSEFPAEASIAKFKENDGWVMVATMRDISARKAREDELNWQATHDPLTALPNRALMHDRLTHALNRSQRNDEAVALIFADLDGFKMINDSYGHAVGDKLLVAIAARLVDVVRPGDTVARFGGDEFIILCERIENLDTIATIAERISEELRKPLKLGDIKLYATASLGISLGKGHSHLPDELVRNADAAMYQAKDQGRDGWKIFETDIHENAKENLAIANGLRTAVSNNELKAVFQPIMDIQTCRVAGAELLLRWNLSDTPIPPDKFIPLAEANGAIIPIGAWIYEQACFAQLELDKLPEHLRPQYLSVNVSARQLSSKALVATFKAILFQTGADPKRIMIELTETALMNDTEANLNVLGQIAALGHTIAVDDFGTGYSSLSRLVQMPVNTLKIDRAFVDEMDRSPKGRALVKAIISIARALGLKVIAEGMETPAQLEILNELGCDHVQGYYFHRPMAFDEFVEVLEWGPIANA